MFFFYLFIALTGTYCISAQRTTADGCFYQWSDSRVSCSQAYDQRRDMTAQECRDMCNRNRACRSAQYSSAAQSCLLFRSYTTRYKRDIEHNIQKRHGGSGCGGGGGGGVTSNRGGTNGLRPPPPVGPRPPPGGRGRKKRYGTSATNCGGSCQAALQKTSGHTYYRSTGRCCPKPATKPPVTDSCPSGQVTRYFLVDGYQLSGSAAATFTASSEQACIDACTNNRIPSGQQGTCRSFDYDTQSKLCSISSQQTGVPQSSPNTAIKHYEKTCVDAEFGNRCKGPYFRGPQKILVGFAQAVISASSNMECLQICVNSQQRFAFTCSSIMYYYQETTNNCILNSETRSTHPDLYISENLDKVDYFEPLCNPTPTRALRQTQRGNKRNRNVLKLNSPDYGGWTLCDGRYHDHKRFRRCTTLNPNSCASNKTTCIQGSEAQYDVPDTSSGEADTTTVVVTTIDPFGPESGEESKNTSTPVSPDNSTNFSKLDSGESKKAAHQEDMKRTKLQMDDDVCRPLVKPDGSTDCQNGMRLGENGKRELCRPKKDNCEEYPIV